MKYSPGKTMLVLDALSRTNIKSWKPEFDENSLMHHVHFVISNLPISNKPLEQFKKETRKDLISHELHPYFTHRSDISYHERLLLKDQRIIVSSALRSKMKSILHQGHLGVEN